MIEEKQLWDWVRVMCAQQDAVLAKLINELKLCPKCHGTAVVHQQRFMIGDDHFCRTVVECRDCGFNISRPNGLQETAIALCTEWQEMERGE